MRSEIKFSQFLRIFLPIFTVFVLCILSDDALYV